MPTLTTQSPTTIDAGAPTLDAAAPVAHVPAIAEADRDLTLDERLAALAGVQVFAGLPADQVRWFAEHAEEKRYAVGETVFTKGSPAEWMTIYLEGEIEARREEDIADTTIYIAQAGDPETEVTGKLPFSRMTEFPSNSRATRAARALLFSEKLFPELTAKMPILVERLVGVMSDRVRSTTKEDQQRDKLMALGKLSAGLAHELNNPAAAARRAAKDLRDALANLRDASASFCFYSLTPEKRQLVTRFEEDLVARAAAAQPLDSLTFSDRESEITDWLDERDLGECWAVAPMLVESEAKIEELERLEEEIGRDTLRAVLEQVTAQLSTARLTAEIETSTGRISELVCAIKEYTYMDRAPVQQVDLHKSLESTLVILNHKIRKANIEVTRDYGEDLPAITAHGSELNQVWTNLLDNAIDAMRGEGASADGEPHAKRLTIHTERKDKSEICVEITDTGGGIPEDVQSHIFDPFFTTKGVGEGTGLGLDTAYRIVRKHHGQITFESRPGRTSFIVRLPVQQPLQP